MRRLLLLLAGGTLGLATTTHAWGDVLSPTSIARVTSAPRFDTVETRRFRQVDSRPVTIRYDEAGIPHVRASSEEAGYAGLCWAAARDRLFQMDLFRRSGAGRLAEIFGSGPDGSVLAQDRILRVQGLARHAAERYAEASPRTRTVLESCALGVNAFREEALAGGTLPLAFLDLGYAPEPWRPEDSVTVLAYMGAGFSNIGMQVKLQRAVLHAVFGPEIADALLPAVPAASLFDRHGNYTGATASGGYADSTPSRPDVAGAPRNAATLQGGIRLPEPLMPTLRATNNFAVAGWKSTSGHALMANDPHLVLSTPGAFYLASLHVVGRYRVSGATIAGLPVFFSGSNDSHTWGLSIATLDDTDLYMEGLRQAEDGEEVLISGAWAPLEQRVERIDVAGEPSEWLTVRTTPHGPILNDAIPALNPFGPLSIRATIAVPEWRIDGYFALPGVRNWRDFRVAVAGTGLGLNFLYADRRGNIGYQLAGLAPQRNRANGYAPVPGWNGAHEWTGYARNEQMPHTYNPRAGVLVTANSRLVPDDYAPDGEPVYLSTFVEQPWRTIRAESVLDSLDSVGLDDLAALQRDVHNPVAEELRDHFVGAVERFGLPPDDGHAGASLAALREWNGMVEADSEGALVFEVVLALLLQHTAQDLIGPELYQGYVQGVFVTRRVDAVRRLLAEPAAPFFGIGLVPGEAGELRDAAVVRALARADELMAEVLGNDRAAWKWGTLHRLGYNHPLAPFDPRFAVPDAAARGDFATLDIGWWGTRAGLLALPLEGEARIAAVREAFAQDALADIRLLWNAGTRQGWGVLATGQNGDPRSPQWQRHAEPWRTGRYFAIGR